MGGKGNRFSISYNFSFELDAFHWAFARFQVLLNSGTLTVRFGSWIQPVNATDWANRSAGVW